MNSLADAEAEAYTKATLDATKIKVLEHIKKLLIYVNFMDIIEKKYESSSCGICLLDFEEV